MSNLKQKVTTKLLKCKNWESISSASLWLSGVKQNERKENSLSLCGSKLPPFCSYLQYVSFHMLCEASPSCFLVGKLGSYPQSFHERYARFFYCYHFILIFANVSRDTPKIFALLLSKSDKGRKLHDV